MLAAFDFDPNTLYQFRLNIVPKPIKMLKVHTLINDVGLSWVFRVMESRDVSFRSHINRVWSGDNKMMKLLNAYDV